MLSESMWLAAFTLLTNHLLSEFALLTALTLNEDVREALRGEISEWLKLFLPKLKRESTRTEKCRLISSVERHEFVNDRKAERFVKFIGKKGILFDENKNQLKDYGKPCGVFKATSFQKKILQKIRV